MWHDIKLLNATANVLFGLCAVLLIACGVWFAMQLPFFTLKVIKVEGTDNSALRHVNVEIIRSTALSRIKGNFFTTNLDSARQAFDAVPWVRNANVRREWPNKLIVTLEEYIPIGTWGDNGQLLSTKGETFIANLAEAEEDTKLLEFSGPPGSEKEVLAHYWEFKDWFKTVSLTPEEVSYSKRYAWSIKLNNGLIVQLGREDSSVILKKRVDRLLDVYPELAERLRGKIESVDLRYPNGFALKSVSLGAIGQKFNGSVKKKKQ